MKKAGHESFVFLPVGAKLSRYCRLLNYPSLLPIDIRFGTPSTAYQSIPHSTDRPRPRPRPRFTTSLTWKAPTHDTSACIDLIETTQHVN
jgi:hypothetical protein